MVRRHVMGAEGDTEEIEARETPWGSLCSNPGGRAEA